LAGWISDLTPEQERAKGRREAAKGWEGGERASASLAVSKGKTREINAAGDPKKK